MNLADFLLARIAEDEERGHDALAEAQLDSLDNLPFLMRRLVVAHGPHRVLAECEAKRRIVGALAQVVGREHDSLEAMAALAACRYSLRQLAQPYAGHPDYREEWKP